MKKTITLILCLVAFCLTSQAIDRNNYITGAEITVDEPGTLDSLITQKYGDRWMYISSIKVSGPLNGADVKALRQLAGGNERGLYSMGYTASIDLSDATIVGSSDVFVRPYTVYEDFTTKDNEIPDYMFFNCPALVNIVLPKNITKIGTHVFESCSALQLATLPENISAIPESTFSGCSSLRSLVIGKSVTKIGKEALKGCSNLLYITCLSPFPATVDDQGDDDDDEGYDDYAKPAFAPAASSTGINVYVPASALANYQKATWWKDNNITASPDGIVEWPTPTEATFDVSGANPLVLSLYKNYPAQLGSITSLTVKGNLSASDFYTIDQIVHSSPVIKLDLSGATLVPSTYRGLYMTYRIDRENAVSNKLFADYYYDYNGTGTIDLVNTIVLPDETSSIGGEALRWYRLKNIQLSSANKNFTVLNNIVYTKDKKEAVTCPLGYEGEINFPSELTTIRDSAFFKCAGVTKAVLPAGVRYLGVRSFQDCVGLTDVVLNEGLPATGKDAFSKCWNLKDVAIPSSVKYVGEATFNDCRAFTKIDVPATVDSLGDDAFASCENVQSITLHEGLKRIGGGAFYNIHTVSSIVIPASVDSIGRNFFTDSLSLRDIYSLNKIPPFAYDDYALDWPYGNTFYGISHETTTLHVPAGTADFYRKAQGWKWFYNIVEDAETVNGIRSPIVSRKDENAANAPLYNLSGQRITTPKQGQIVIRKGKKFIWK